MAHKKTKTRNALKDLTRRHIHEAVIRAVTRVGVNGLTMDMIAEEARIAKGTIYLHFRTKDELVRETIATCLAPMVDELVAILESDLPPDERLLRFTRRHLAYFEDHRYLFRVLVHERGRTRIRGGRHRSGVYEKLVEKTTAAIALGVQSGVFRSVDPVRIAGMVVDANITVIGQRLLEDQPASARDDADFLCGVFMNGIRRLPATDNRGEPL